MNVIKVHGEKVKIQLHFPSHANKTGSRITIKQWSGNIHLTGEPVCGTKP